MTTMTPEEVIKEYKRDYPEIRRRMESYLQANNRILASNYKNAGITEFSTFRTTVIERNRYRIHLVAQVKKEGFYKFLVTVYQILEDAKTGKPRIWLLSTPGINGGLSILEFKPEFIKKLYPEKPLKEAVDRLMSKSGTFTIYLKPESTTYGFEASFGDKLVGLGNLEGIKYIFEKLYRFSEIEEMGDSLGLEGDQDPLKVYNMWVESKKTPKLPEISEDLGEEERRKREIELAWKEYEYT